MNRKSRFWMLLAALPFCAAAVSAAPCAAGPSTLCLSGERFSVSVQWKDFQGRTGQGQAVGLTTDTGYFWFFNDANIELVVKVLDARAINQRFWVFFGALSNVEYTLSVTDTATGAAKNYVNPSGQFALSRKLPVRGDRELDRPAGQRRRRAVRAALAGHGLLLVLQQFQRRAHGQGPRRARVERQVLGLLRRALERRIHDPGRRHRERRAAQLPQ